MHLQKMSVSVLSSGAMSASSYAQGKVHIMVHRAKTSLVDSPKSALIDWSHCCMQAVHSDIKSGNVLLNEDASIAKIADVGTSRLLEQTCTTGTMMCTFSYAAPEQMFGIREACNEKVHQAALSCRMIIAH